MGPLPLPRPGAWCLALVVSAFAGRSADASIVPVRSQASRWRLSAHPPCPEGWKEARPRRRARARCADAREVGLPGSPAPERRRPLSRPRPESPTHELDADAIAALDARACREQLDHASVGYQVLEPAAAPSVAQPIRLTGPHRGSDLPAVLVSRSTDRSAWDLGLSPGAGHSAPGCLAPGPGCGPGRVFLGPAGRRGRQEPATQPPQCGSSHRRPDFSPQRADHDRGRDLSKRPVGGLFEFAHSGC